MTYKVMLGVYDAVYSGLLPFLSAHIPATGPSGVAWDTAHLPSLSSLCSLRLEHFLCLCFKNSHLSKARVFVLLQLSGVLKGPMCASVRVLKQALVS